MAYTTRKSFNPLRGLSAFSTAGLENALALPAPARDLHATVYFGLHPAHFTPRNRRKSSVAQVQLIRALPYTHKSFSTVGSARLTVKEARFVPEGVAGASLTR